MTIVSKAIRRVVIAAAEWALAQARERAADARR
jgi:hypothetical protein